MFELKPCPFCGGEVILETVDGNSPEECYIYTVQSVILKVAYIANPNLSSKSGTGGLTMTLTEMFTICDSCVCAPCLCGNDPENCVAYVMRTSDNG